MDRRGALGIIALGSMLALQACTSAARPAGNAATPVPTATPAPAPARPVPAQIAAPVPVAAPPASVPPLVRVPLPGGSLSELPGENGLLALTVDDGASSEVVAAYAQFARDTGTRITFFLNGQYDAWTANADALRPLVDSGQVQLGNHTFSHPDLTSLTDAGVVDELTRNETFIQNTYGVSGAPYFRPPFGYHDDRVDALAADIGYSVPTLWYGSLSDSGLITREQLLGFADQWLLPEHIVIGHANFPTVVECFDRIHEIIGERGLRTVTLDDVFEKP